MKKRTTITTEKREVWIIRQGDLRGEVPADAFQSLMTLADSSETESEIDPLAVPSDFIPTPDDSCSG